MPKPSRYRDFEAWDRIREDFKAGVRDRDGFLIDDEDVVPETPAPNAGLDRETARQLRKQDKGKGR